MEIGSTRIINCLLESRLLQTSVSKTGGKLVDKVQPDLATEAVQIHDQVFP